MGIQVKTFSNILRFIDTTILVRHITHIVLTDRLEICLWDFYRPNPKYKRLVPKRDIETQPLGLRKLLLEQHKLTPRSFSIRGYRPEDYRRIPVASLPTFLESNPHHRILGVCLYNDMNMIRLDSSYKCQIVYDALRNAFPRFEGHKIQMFSSRFKAGEDYHNFRLQTFTLK